MVRCEIANVLLRHSSYDCDVIITRLTMIHRVGLCLVLIYPVSCLTWKFRKIFVSIIGICFKHFAV